MGYEVHVVAQSKIRRPSLAENLHRYTTCIFQGCEAFNKNMRAALEKAESAAKSLPELEDMEGAQLEAILKQWQSELR